MPTPPSPSSHLLVALQLSTRIYSLAHVGFTSILASLTRLVPQVAIYKHHQKQPTYITPPQPQSQLAAATGTLPPMATLTPPLSPRRHSGGFFELPHKKWRRRRMTINLMQQEERDRAAREAEMASRTRACNYLTTFLHSSPWTDQLDQITIVWDSVPAMEELESYGDLDEKEGTRNCRRLFKAVVVWDEVGHLLWQTLKAASQQRRALEPAAPVAEPMDIARTSTDGSDAWWHSPLGHCSRRGSQETTNSSLASGEQYELKGARHADRAWHGAHWRDAFVPKSSSPSSGILALWIK
ncbi:hypothetical protein V2A60_002842 [Cordyceps javanica]